MTRLTNSGKIPPSLPANEFLLSLEAIPIDSNSSRDGFRQELNPSYGLHEVRYVWERDGVFVKSNDD